MPLKRVAKTLKVVRNHWKKSAVAAVALSYGYGVLQERAEANNLMKVYCEKAAEYGKQPLRKNEKPRNITVILNPTANRRKAEDEFEKYCAPILHLAGITVDVIKTESEGHARTLISELSGASAVIVAGGDGTVSEVVTGLMRRTKENTAVPVGFLPLGRANNTLAQSLFSTGNDHLEKIRALAEASLAVVTEKVKPIDILKVEVLEEDNKPIYAVSGVKWGAYRDAEIKKDSYWYYGSLRKYATYLFNGYKNSLTWNCSATINFGPPCSGCSNCQAPKFQPVPSWVQRLNISGSRSPDDLPLALNPQCLHLQEKDISTVDLTISVPNGGDVPKLQLNLGPQFVDYLNFVKEGWRSETEKKRDVRETIEARFIEIKPKVANKSEEAWFSIDNENYELKPIRVTILPRSVKVFCRDE